VARSATTPERILVNLSGRGDKDLETVLRHLSPGGAA
jgi:tryptophan synthase beta subunit